MRTIGGLCRVFDPLPRDVMDRAIYRSFVFALAVSVLVAGRSAADDDPLKEQALKLNQVTGTNAMNNRLRELVKDEAGTKKLLATAAKMVKDTPASEASPLNYNACMILAKAAQVQKDTDTALIFYRACAKEASKVGSASKLIDVFDAMVNMYVVNKKYDEAIQACQEFLSLEIEDLDNPINRAKPIFMEKLIYSTSKKGKLDEALKMTEDLIEKDKGGWYFIRLKGEILRDAEKHSDAADAYLEAIERLKKSQKLDEDEQKIYLKEMRYILSNVYVEMKQIDKGTEQLEMLMKDDPDNPTFLNDLGFIWADNDMKFDEAEKLIRKAIEKDREQRKKIEDLPKEDDVDSAAYLDSLGWVLFKKKDYKEAKKYLLEATKLKGGKHIEIYDHLADAHMTLGEKAEAIKVWKEALELKDISKRDIERRKTIEKKLAEAEKK
jgi:tetratricopeptide (TPR) repeat protein